MNRYKAWRKRQRELRAINAQLKKYAGRHEGTEYLTILLPISTELLDRGQDTLAAQLAGEVAGKLAYEATRKRMSLVSEGGIRVP
jgi:hypothetical protein